MRNKDILKKLVPYKVRKQIRTKKEVFQTRNLIKNDRKRFLDYSFGDYDNLNTYEQLEARITKAYHSIEKGLAHKEIRLGFGDKVLKNLMNLMDIYRIKNFPLNAEFYQTALSNLDEYVKLHEENNFNVSSLKNKVKILGERGDNSGGAIHLTKKEILQSAKSDFKNFATSRHSIRNFSGEAVDIKILEDAIDLAKKTPSACNRQGWSVRIVQNPELKRIIQDNQNGNRGFGEKIDKFLLITTDTQYFAKSRERNQPFIDGGMYAMNLLYSLHYFGVAAVPLSAALTNIQEENIRYALDMKDSENFIIFIGVGNYIDKFKIPKSTRRKPNLIIH